MKREAADNTGRVTAIGLFLTLLFIVFIVDIITNLVTGIFKLPAVPESIVDGLLVLLFAFPVLYLSIFKPLSSEVSERKRLEEEFRSSRNYLSRVINSVADPIFVKDRQHRLVLINNAFCAFVGLPASGVIGRADSDFFSKEQVDIFLKNDETVFSTGKENVSEAEVSDSNGVTHIISTKKTLYTNSSGERFIVGVIRDITERKRIEKMKDEFVGTVSHELRTPLSITKEGINLILDKISGPINEEQARILSISRNNIDRLVRIINSLLDITKIESGKIGLRYEAFSAPAAIRQVINAFELKVKDAGLALKADLPEGDMIICGDPDGVTQVLTNLLGNSIKFTRQGEIVVSLKDKGSDIEMSVSDTGIGIAKEDMPKLFDKFQQFGRVAWPGEKGTGLGLAIAKGIVEAHKGRMWAESEPGKGTKIFFTLPKTIKRRCDDGKEEDTGRG